MITYYDKGQILKGSDVEIVFRLAPQCSTVDFSQVENLTVDFFTQAGGESIEKTAEALSITGSTALVHFQWEEFEEIPDGVLRYVVTYEIEGERTVYETSSSFYLKTPSAYTAQTFVTEENVQEIVNEEISGSTALTETVEDIVDNKMENYYTSAQTESAITSAITEAVSTLPKDIFFDKLTRAEKTALFAELNTELQENGDINAKYRFFWKFTNGTNYIQLQYVGTDNGGEWMYFGAVLQPMDTDETAIYDYHLKFNGDQGVAEVTKRYITRQELNSELGKYYTSGQTESAITSALANYSTSAETAQAISTATQGMVTSTEINKIWTGTQAEYDQISPKLNTTLYFIKES